MSLVQRWRALQFGAKDLQRQLGAQVSALPPVAALLAALTALRLRLQPLVDLADLAARRAEDLNESYNQFLAEETKRQWTWSKRYAGELLLWKQVPPYLFFLVVTLVYQVFIPVSVACALAVPLYYAWALWDRWWLSPIFLGTLLMAPLKFVPWAPISLLWPGLI